MTKCMIRSTYWPVAKRQFKAKVRVRLRKDFAFFDSLIFLLENNEMNRIILRSASCILESISDRFWVSELISSGAKCLV